MNIHDASGDRPDRLDIAPKDAAEPLLLTWEEAQKAWNKGLPAWVFQGEGSMFGEFAFTSYGRPPGFLDLPERDQIMLLWAEPCFDTGSVLWLEDFPTACQVAQAHRAAGHYAFVLEDLDEDEFVVLTDWCPPPSERRKKTGG